MAAPKNVTSAPKATSARAFQQRIEAAQAKAHQAQAKVDLHIAKAKVAGHDVGYDYSGHGAPKLKVTPAKK